MISSNVTSNVSSWPRASVDLNQPHRNCTGVSSSHETVTRSLDELRWLSDPMGPWLSYVGFKVTTPCGYHRFSKVGCTLRGDD